MIDLINDEIKSELGYKIGDDDVKTALQHFVIELSEEDFEEEFKTEESKKATTKQNRYDEEHQFNGGKWSHSRELYNKLKEKLEAERQIKYTKYSNGFIH